MPLIWPVMTPMSAAYNYENDGFKEPDVGFVESGINETFDGFDENSSTGC